MEFFEFKTIEVIDENFSVIEWHHLQMIYSADYDMINATKLVPSISSKKFRKWSETCDGKLFENRFPYMFKEITNKELKGSKDINRVVGTYIHKMLIKVVVSWANAMRGFYLVNNLRFDIETDMSGYIYIVQTKEFLNTNKYKIGRTWRPEQRFKQYGTELKIIKCEKVSDMFKAENNLKYEIKEYVNEPFKGTEWFECELEDILYYFNEACNSYPINEEIEELTKFH